MSVDAAALIFTVAVIIGSVGLVLVLSAAARTLAVLRHTVEDVHRVTMPLLADAHVAVQRASFDLERVDTLLTTVESIAGTVDSASKMAHNAVGSPLVKVMATSAGVAGAWRRFRHQ
jgi:uncharacterized protein YoxC